MCLNYFSMILAVSCNCCHAHTCHVNTCHQQTDQYGSIIIYILILGFLTYKYFELESYHDSTNNNQKKEKNQNNEHLRSLFYSETYDPYYDIKKQKRNSKQKSSALLQIEEQ